MMKEVIASKDRLAMHGPNAQQSPIFAVELEDLSFANYHGRN
jgi:hypothetical protein